MPITTYELKVNYSRDRELATYDFDDKGAEKRCCVKVDDMVNVTFHGPGIPADCVLLSGQIKNGESASPFTLPSPIDLKKTPLLTVGKHTGKWGFSIAFTVLNEDGTTSFYYVPDPEIVVDPNPDPGSPHPDAKSSDLA